MGEVVRPGEQELLVEFANFRAGPLVIGPQQEVRCLLGRRVRLGESLGNAGPIAGWLVLGKCSWDRRGTGKRHCGDDEARKAKTDRGVHEGLRGT